MHRASCGGGSLTILCALFGTPHFPQGFVDGGILFLEDVAEHPYRVERMLLQLLQAGILSSQSAVLLGNFSGWKPSPWIEAIDSSPSWTNCAGPARFPIYAADLLCTCI